MSIEYSDLQQTDALELTTLKERSISRRFAMRMLGGSGIALLTGCDSEVSTQPSAPVTTSATPEVAPTSPPVTPEVEKPLFSVEGLSNKAARTRAESIISTFENSTTTIKYDYAENIGDGRGITAGRSGFTSGTADLLEVVALYEQMTTEPHNALAKYVKPLQLIEAERQASGNDMSDSIKGLEGFEEAWKITSKSDTALNKAQDAVYTEMYFDPAMKRATEVGVHSAIGQLIILDTMIQHGEGDADEELDGLPAILGEVVKKHGTPKNAKQEIIWLDKFLETRQKHLHDPMDKDNKPTTAAWRKSIPRVTSLRSILASGNYDLQPPLTWESYGRERFSLTT